MRNLIVRIGWGEDKTYIVLSNYEAPYRVDNRLVEAIINHLKTSATAKYRSHATWWTDFNHIEIVGETDAPSQVSVA